MRLTDERSPDNIGVPHGRERSEKNPARSVWWRWEESNLRHGAYETPALPLSYTAFARKFA